MAPFPGGQRALEGASLGMGKIPLKQPFKLFRKEMIAAFLSGAGVSAIEAGQDVSLSNILTNYLERE